MGKEIKDLNGLLKAMEETIDIPDGHKLVAVFKDNGSDEIKGFLCVEEGVEGDYPLMSLSDLLAVYGDRDRKIIDGFECPGCGSQRCTGEGWWLAGCELWKKYIEEGKFLTEK